MTKDEAFDVLEKSKPKISEGSLKHITYNKAITVLKEKLTQRQWVGLTDDELEKFITDAGFTRTDLLMIGACVEQIVELVEAKLKEKNT